MEQLKTITNIEKTLNTIKKVLGKDLTTQDKQEVVNLIRKWIIEETVSESETPSYRAFNVITSILGESDIRKLKVQFIEELKQNPTEPIIDKSGDIKPTNNYSDPIKDDNKYLVSEKVGNVIKKYKPENIIVTTMITTGGLKTGYSDMYSPIQAVKDITDWPIQEVINARETKKPLKIIETEKDYQKSVDIYFPRNDVERRGNYGYIGLKILIPNNIDISKFKDAYIEELSQKYYSFNDLSTPKKGDYNNSQEQVKEFSIFAKQLFANKANQYIENTPNN